VLFNQGLIDKTLLFNVKLVRIDRRGARWGGWGWEGKMVGGKRGRAEWGEVGGGRKESKRELNRNALKVSGHAYIMI
jgi:hypothetical protein